MIYEATLDDVSSEHYYNVISALEQALTSTFEGATGHQTAQIQTIKYVPNSKIMTKYMYDNVNIIKNSHRFEPNLQHVQVHRSPAIERLIVRGSLVALKHVIHGMKTRALMREQSRRTIEKWVPCGVIADNPSLLKNIRNKSTCGFAKFSV